MIRSLLLIMASTAIILPCAHCTDNATAHLQPQQRRNKTNFIYSDASIEHPEFNNDSKVMIEGGLYTNQKFERISTQSQLPVSNIYLTDNL